MNSRLSLQHRSQKICLFAALAGAAWGASARAQTPSVLSAAPKSLHLEAEAATLFGCNVATNRAGFTGRGFVTGLDNDSDKLLWKLPPLAPGFYEVNIRYCSPYGEKGYDMVVNGVKTSGMLDGTGDAFAVKKAGKIELRAGANTLAIEKGWGYYDLDAIDLVPISAAPALKKVAPTLVDPQATAQAQALMSYLASLYGQKTLSGQQGDADVPFIVQSSGKTPAILGGDLVEYSPSRIQFGAKPDVSTETLIQNARAGYILTVSWHWNAPAGLYNKNYTNGDGNKVEAPWWYGFNTNASNFDVQKALANPNSKDYKLLLRDIDAIAVQLKKLQAAQVPVLWRPLHEAEGGWFWWGAKGPDSFKTLWRLMFDRFTKVHGLHNLIWVYTSAGKPEWYPGDSYVDIVGTDAYPPQMGDPLSDIWDTLRTQFDGKKLLALSEIGAVPDVDKMRRYGVTWSYFMSWEGEENGPSAAPKTAVAHTYQGATVLNRDQLPTRLRPPQPPR